MLSEELKRRKFLFLPILSLFAILLLGQKFSLVFQYDRYSIINGEYWRILTCHFVHTGWKHLFLNLVGFILVFSLFKHLYSLHIWSICAIFCMLGISLFSLFFCPNLEWFMGLSGLLHGMFVIGVIGEIRKGDMLYCLGLLAITTKLVIEYFAGPSDFTSQFINAIVITNAHFSGAITGGITAIVIIFASEIFPIRLLKITQSQLG